MLRMTYIFWAIVVALIDSKPLTYIVPTKHASRRLLHALQVDDLQKMIQSSGLFYLISMLKFGVVMVIPIDVG